MKALPEALQDGPFSTAGARALGVRSQRLSRSDLVIVTHGSRAHSEPVELVDRAAAYLVAIRGDVALSHVTAAQLWGLPLPRGLEAQADLDVMREAKGPVRRDGCIGHRGLARREVVRHRNLPVTSLADTWVDLGEVTGRGMELDDLVVAGDVVVRELDREHGPGEGLRRLEACLAARVRPRGKVLLGQALPLLSPRTKSPMETRARLVFEKAGLPRPELNVAVHFDRDAVGDGVGGWMLEADFVWRRQRVLGEYQGAHHAAIGQRAIDADRRHLAEDEGWSFVEVFAADVYSRPKRMALIRRLGRALGVDDADLKLF